MHAVYVINEEPLYMTMAAYSLRSLRLFNPSLPTTVYFVEDGCRDSRKIFDKGRIADLICLCDKIQFLKDCDALNVEVKIVKDLPLGEQSSFAPAHRLVLADCKHQNALYIDADTCIFAELSSLFEIYKHFDVVATTNTFGDKCTITWKDHTIRSFNSGVILFNNNLIRKYGEAVCGYCLSLYNKTHPMGEWIHHTSEDACGREELAFSLFVIDNNLRYGYFHHADVEKEVFTGPTKIFHVMSPRWPEFYLEMNSKK